MSMPPVPKGVCRALSRWPADTDAELQTYSSTPSSKWPERTKTTFRPRERWAGDSPVPLPPLTALQGSLYLRPLLIGTGPILGLAPAPEYTFVVYASPVASYFKAR